MGSYVDAWPAKDVIRLWRALADVRGIAEPEDLDQLDPEAPLDNSEAAAQIRGDILEALDAIVDAKIATRFPDEHMPSSKDPSEADDLALIGKLAEQLGWSRFGSDEETEINVGDWEIQYAVAVRDGVHLMERIERGVHRTIGTFESGAEARRFLIMELAASARDAQPAPADPVRKTARAAPPRHVAPAEVPPADAFVGLDRPVIEKAAHELGWQLLPVKVPDLLAVSSDGVGRVISFRLESYVYESFAEDHRYGKASFTSFRCARRFMIMDMATILRSQRRLPPLRPSHPAAGYSIERAPTGYRLIGPDCDATFSIGPVGHRYALDFSRVAVAEPDQIRDSFLNPDGAPLFT